MLSTPELSREMRMRTPPRRPLTRYPESSCHNIWQSGRQRCCSQWRRRPTPDFDISNKCSIPSPTDQCEEEEEGSSAVYVVMFLSVRSTDTHFPFSCLSSVHFLSARSMFRTKLRRFLTGIYLICDPREVFLLRLSSSQGKLPLNLNFI